MQSLNETVEGPHSTSGASQILAGTALVIDMVAGLMLALWLVAAIFAFTL